ncbi:cupredoxin family copper-binding protein [Mycobacterium sp.]|uniref:cupredoxin domain-containing protein n=1 Tax=Mycobacterium sp. TaxID=1785 RepID=UPI0028BF38E6|nr:cupredoxin family copper-binding protein [Mycobacterium sp.]
MAAISACSSSKNSQPATTQSASSAQSGTSAAAGGTAVSVANFSFSPGTLTVPAGSTVTWTFKDSTDHNVTADDKSFASKNSSSGATYSFHFTKAGTYSYMCTIHPFMTAKVVVQ